MHRPTTLRARLLLTLLGFVLLGETIVAASILHTTYDQTLSRARGSLRVGERVLDQLMTLRANQLLSTVNVLASDFGFKSAVATHDGPTLKSVLANFANRGHADIAMLANTNGQLMAGIPADIRSQDTPQFKALLTRARHKGGATGLATIANRAYQFVLVPVDAPRLIAWVGMGFKIDNALAHKLASLTGLNVEFVVRDGPKERFRTGTLGSSTPAANGNAVFHKAGFLTRQHTLLHAGDTQLSVVLALKRSTVLSAYYSLARSLAMIFVVTLIISVLAAIWLARKISQPVSDLSRFAESVAAGNYSPAPKSQAIGELNVLTDALNEMQNAVRHRENRIRHQATHDHLTNLPNREMMRHTLRRCFHEKRRFAAARIGIHGFARINGALGYQLGDRVLKTVAERLSVAIESDAVVGRIEGNDFLILVETHADESTVAQMLEGLRSQVQTPILVQETPIAVQLEIGALIAPRMAEDTEAVWRRTVIARNQSRAANGRTSFYQAGMDESRTRELTIIQDLAPALRAGQLSIVYQPKMSLLDGSVREVEALSRWTHPHLGIISPDEFISLAERSGQIHTLTQWLVQRLTEQLRDWRRAGSTLGVSLNLSGDELAQANLEHTLSPLLEAAGHPSDITLEVTESALLREPEAALANLRRLQARGARVAVDDFGSGYSSLAQLKQLSADELKIDKSLVLKIDTTPADQFIVRTIVELGHKLGLQVVVEGIENAASWRFLIDVGADMMQGYYLARPMPASTLIDWTRRHARTRAQWSADATAIGDRA